MDAEGFLRSTPVEINWKIEAYNDARRYDASRDYRSIVHMAIAWHNPKKLPPFEKFYPENNPGRQKPKVGANVAKAMATAAALGHI
jgi:hypothetical protein